MPTDPRLIDLMERRDDGDPIASLDVTEPELVPKLERAANVQRWLEGVIGHLAPGAVTVSLEAETEAQAGEFPAVPGYRLVRRLSEGGMGQVYLARKVGLRREVALKVIRPDKLTGELRERFRREGQAIALLDHPHIVTVHHVGEFETPTGEKAPFLEMEYVPGGTLADHAREPMAPHEAARVVCLLAKAMAHAHQKGVVHRDLKPANVLIAPHADEPALNAAVGRPKVTDFGLARQEGASAGRTAEGSVMGTPAYMAPEQARGEKAGTPADVYALGAILYRLLTGRPVFEGDTVHDTLSRVCHEPPTPPRQVVAGVPAGLEDVCLRCLSKRVDDRPTAAGLARLLEPGVETKPLPRPAVRGRRWAVAALAAVPLVAVPLAVLAWRGLTRPTGALPPLKAVLDAMMTRPGDIRRQSVPLSDPASRPLQPKDEIRVMAELSRPGYVYLVWIDTEGNVTPMYPWIDGDWTRRGQEVRAKGFKLPQEKGQWWWWPMGPGKRGLETMVLLCRDEPLPADVDVKRLLGSFGPQPLDGQDATAVTWFEDGEMVRDEPTRAPQVKAVAGSNALERVNREMWQRAKGSFGTMRSITYGNAGGG